MDQQALLILLATASALFSLLFYGVIAIAALMAGSGIFMCGRAALTWAEKKG